MHFAQFATSMQDVACPKNSNDSDDHPEHIKDGIGKILSKDRTPREHYRVNRIKDPNEHEWTGGTKPGYQAKAGNSHQDPN